MNSGHAQTARARTSTARKYLHFPLTLILITSILSLSTWLTGCAGVTTSAAKQTASVASFQVSPTTLNFGQVAVGKQATQSVSISNTGNVGLSITQLTLSNPQFSVSGASTPMAIAAGQSGSFTIGVNPTSAGTLTGTLTVQGSAGSTPVVVNLSATAVSGQAQLSLSQSSLSFGNVSVGTKATDTLVLSNSGATDLTISLLTLTGSDFTISGITTPKTIPAGQSAPLSITFTPTGTGNATGSLVITSNDAANATIAVPLTGSGSTKAIGQLSPNPSSLSFGSVTTGTSNQKQVVVTNSGNAAVNITGVTSSGAGFTVSGVNLPSSLNPSQSATLTVTFDPTQGGSVSGSISIASNAGNSPLLIQVTGSGQQTSNPKSSGQLSVNPSTLSFGTVAAGTLNQKQVTVTNSGNAAVSVTGVTALGAGFTVSGVNLPLSLNPSQTATLTVGFNPTQSGSLSGSVSIVSNATNSPLTIQVTGAGSSAQPGLALTPNTYSFATMVDGQTKPQTITINNTGAAALTIAGVTVNGADFSVSGISTPLTIAAGSSGTFSVLFAPTTPGSHSATVSIASNAPNSPTVLTLTGSSTASTVNLSANPTTLSFSTVNAGSSSSKSVTVTNSGNASLTISQINVNAKNFAVSGISTPLTLAAGQSAPMTVSFSPPTAENVTGNITVVSSQGANSVVVVSGTGVQAGLTVTPSSASFGDVTVGSPSSQTVQLTNSGNGTLTISQVSVAGNGFGTSTLALPINLAAGQSSNFNVQFAPSSAGSATGSVTIVSNAPNSPTAIPLSGTGVSATQTLSFSTTNIGFGSVNTGSSATQPVTVTNTGNTSITISQITASGTGFSLSGASAPVSLGAGQSTSFNVVFSPTSSGNDSGSVTVASTANGSPAKITLSGTGAQASTSYSVALSWTTSTSTVSGYNVYRSTSNGSGYVKLNSGGLVTGVTYTDTTVQSGTTYYYVVTSVNSSGQESGDSNQATAVVP